MATIAQQGDPDLEILVNASGSGGVFRVSDDSTGPPTVLFTVQSDGGVVLLGSVFRDDSTPIHVDNENLSGTGDLVFLQDGASPVTRFVFSVESSGVRIAPGESGDAMQLSGGEVRFLKASGTGDILTFFEGGGDPIARFTDSGLSLYRDADITIQLDNADGNGDAVLTLGNPTAEVRGHCILHRDDTTSAEQQSVVILRDENGAAHYLWIDTNGQMLIRGSDPGTDDAPPGSLVVGP